MASRSCSTGGAHLTRRGLADDQVTGNTGRRRVCAMGAAAGVANGNQPGAAGGLAVAGQGTRRAFLLRASAGIAFVTRLRSPFPGVAVAALESCRWRCGRLRGSLGRGCVAQFTRVAEGLTASRWQRQEQDEHETEEPRDTHDLNPMTHRCG